MLSYKERAKEILRLRIVNFKTEESLDEFIEATIEEMWNIFEDSVMDRYEKRKGIKVNGI